MTLPHLHFDLRRRFPTLRGVGIAVEYFPAYHHPRRTHRITHDVLYCSLLLSGEAMHHLDGERYPESAGMLSVVHYDSEHEIVTGPDPVEIFNIYLDPQRHALPTLPTALGAQVYRVLPLHERFAHRLNRLNRVRLTDARKTAGWLHGIQQEQRTGDAAAETALLALTSLFLLDVARAVQAQEGPVAAGVDADPAMEIVRQHLDEHAADEVFLGQLAELVDLSPAHVCRRFTRYVGCPPMRYLRNRRLQQAMLRLRGSSDRVLEIALDCGFADLAYFNRCFKEVAGCTPTTYRARSVTAGSRPQA